MHTSTISFQIMSILMGEGDIAPFQKGFNKPFNLILGPGNIAMAHQTDEYVEIKKLNQSKEIYKFLINEYC